MEKENKFFYISYEKENKDIKSLAGLIKQSGWLEKDTIFVNCYPDYSSRVVQTLNHSLSHLNKNNLYQVLNLEVPYPNMSQVWSQDEKKYLPFDKYLAEWVRLNLDSNERYLFLFSDITENKYIPRIRSQIKTKLGYAQFRFACLYIQDGISFTPDYYVHGFIRDNGEILYQWENIDNKDWN